MAVTDVWQLAADGPDVTPLPVMARSGRRAPNRGNVVEDPLWDRIADSRNPGCQGQLATHSRPQPRALGPRVTYRFPFEGQIPTRSTSSSVISSPLRS